MKILAILILVAAALAVAAQQIKHKPQMARVDQVVTNVVYAPTVLIGPDAALVKSQLQSITNADGNPIFDTFTASNRYVTFKFFSENGMSITVQ